MALIPCPECGVSISERAAACPSCGCPNAPVDPPAPRGYRRIKIGTILHVAGLLLLIAAWIAFIFGTRMGRRTRSVDRLVYLSGAGVAAAWMVFTVLTGWAVRARRACAPTLALVRTIVSPIGAAVVLLSAGVCFAAVMLLQGLGALLVIPFLMELAAEILLLSGQIGVWRARATFRARF